ncbi:MAG: Gfo/Idh/MocA family oxidoreductase [Elusimicrobiales bacterium]
MTPLKAALLGFPPDSGPLLAAAMERAGFKAAAVCDADPARLAEARRLMPEAAGYATAEDLFSRSGGLDAAIVACTAQNRGRTALRALENRLHTACLTPFCSSTSEFETLREAAAAAGRALFPLQPWERSQAWLAVEKAVSSGLIGEPDYAEVQDLSSTPAPAGGVTQERGWRAFALLLALLRRPPTALSARLSPAGAPGDAAAAAHVHFGGADGFVRLACGRHAPLLRLAAHGDGGRLELEGTTLRLDVKGLAPETVRLKEGLGDGAAANLAAELSAFRSEVSGKTPRGGGLRNARYCAKLLKNVHYSAGLRSAAVPL